MRDARTEISGFHMTVDQFDRQHIVVEYSEYVSQPRDDRIAHGWRTYMTVDGLTVTRMDDGVFVTTEAPILTLETKKIV